VWGGAGRGDCGVTTTRALLPPLRERETRERDRDRDRDRQRKRWVETCKHASPQQRVFH